ncbi:MAG: secretin N-terminal domain-containing protein [Armatimonadota bacterium]
MRYLFKIIPVILLILCAFAYGQSEDGQSNTADQMNNKQNAGNQQVYQMSFDKADIGSVLKFLSFISRIPVVADPDLKGNATIICSNPLSLREVYEVISAALRVRGYSMAGGLDSKVIRVISLKKAITDTTSVTSGKDLQSDIADDNLVTHVIPLSFADSDKLRDVLKSLVSSDQANISSITASNTLVITDNAANVRRLITIIQNVDKDTLGALEVGIYQCKYANAESLATTLTSLFAKKTNTNNNQQRMPIMMPGGPGGPGGMFQSQTGSDSSQSSVRTDVTIASDSRTNRLIITGAKERIAQIIDAAKELDLDVESEVKVKFFMLQHADAESVADQLSNLFEQSSSTSRNQNAGIFPFGAGNNQSSQTTTYAGMKRNMVVADVRTNAIIVTATEQNMKAFESMIKQLDAPNVLTDITKIYPLKYADSDDLADSLNQLFQGATSRSSSASNSSMGGGGFARTAFGLGGSSSQNDNSPLTQLKNITVVSEPKTNSLLITGPPYSTTVLDKMIEQLDRRTAQVFIEVAIVDVTLDDNSKFGVEWEWIDSHTTNSGKNINHDTNTNFGLSSESLGLKYNIVSDNLSVLLHALKTRSNVKVLSTPTITTADNVEASISIGQDEPFVSSETETTGGNIRRTVDFKNVAISLTVTPHVNDTSDVIALDVNQTINEIIGREAELDAPIIANRQAITSVSVKSGQTIIIGGIIKENIERVNKRVPILSEIPILGALFKSKENKKQKSELMVFLTPHVLKTEDDIDRITKQTHDVLSVKPPKSIISPVEVTDSAPGDKTKLSTQ